MASREGLQLLGEAAALKTGDEASPVLTTIFTEPLIQDPQQQTGSNEQTPKDEPLTPTMSVSSQEPILTTKKLRAEDGSAVPTATLLVSSLLPSNVGHPEASPPPASAPPPAPVPIVTTATTTDPKLQQLEALVDASSQISADNMPAFIKLISDEEFASTFDLRLQVIVSVQSTKDPQALSIFVKDGGLKIFNAWLEEASKDKDKTADVLINWLFRGLSHLPITLEALKSSKIGKTIQKMANSSDLSKDTATQCINLITKWKKIAHAASIAPDYIKDASRTRRVKTLAEPTVTSPTTPTSAAAAAAKKVATLTISSAKLAPLSADDIRKMKLKQRLLSGSGTPKPAKTTGPPAAAGHDTSPKEKKGTSMNHSTHDSSLVVARVSPVSSQQSHLAPSSSMGVPASNGSVNKSMVTMKSEHTANRVPNATSATPPILLHSALASPSTNGKKPRRRISWAEGDKLTQIRTYTVEEPETSQQTGIPENTMTLIQTLLHNTHDEKQLEKQMLMKKREEQNRRLEAMKPSVGWSKPTRGIWLVSTIEPTPTEEARTQIERERHVPAIPAAFVEKSPKEPQEFPPEKSINIPIIPGEEVLPQIEVIPPPPILQQQPRQQHSQQPLGMHQPYVQQLQPYQQLPPGVGQVPQTPTAQHLQTLADDPNLIMNLIGMLSGGQQTTQQQQQQQPPFIQTPQQQYPQMQAPQQLQAPQGLYVPQPPAFPGDFMQMGMPYGQQFQQPPQPYNMMPPQHIAPPQMHPQHRHLHLHQQQQQQPPPPAQMMIPPQYQPHGGMMMMAPPPQPAPPLSPSHQSYYQGGSPDDGDKTPYLKRVPCRFFQSGNCKNGSQCQFYHQGVDPIPRGGLAPQPPEDTSSRPGRRKDRDHR